MPIRLCLVVLLTLLVAVASCTRTARLAREPALLFDGPALQRLLERPTALASTRAGRFASALRERTKDCPELAGHFGDDPATTRPAAGPGAAASGSALDRLRCRAQAALPDDLADHLVAQRGDHAGYLQWPIGATGALALWLDVDPDGGLALTGELRPGRDADEVLGALSLLLPDERPPAPSAIAAADPVVHLKLRSAGGTGLARFIAPDSQGDRLFALRGRLLEGALLEGTVELAFLAPATGGQVPLALLALHHRGATAIEGALTEVLDRLGRTWAIEPVARRFETAGGPSLTGGCYAELPLLPELAPCWVVSDRALYVGYRAEAIEAALRGALARTGPRPGDPGGSDSDASTLLVDLDRIRAVDQRIVPAREVRAAGTPLAPPGAGSPGIADLYSRLELRGLPDEDGTVRLTGALRARP